MRHHTHSNTTSTFPLARAFSIGFLSTSSALRPLLTAHARAHIASNSILNAPASRAPPCFASLQRRTPLVDEPQTSRYLRTRARGFGQDNPPRIRQSRILSSHPRRRTSRAKTRARRRKLFFSTIPTRATALQGAPSFARRAIRVAHASPTPPRALSRALSRVAPTRAHRSNARRVDISRDASYTYLCATQT
jgi:hypothetical protein